MHFLWWLIVSIAAAAAPAPSLYSRSNSSLSLDELKDIVARTPDGLPESAILAFFMTNKATLQRSQSTTDFQTFNTTVRYLEGGIWKNETRSYTASEQVTDQSKQPLNFSAYMEALKWLLLYKPDVDPMALVMAAFSDSQKPYTIRPSPCRLAVQQRMGKVNIYATYPAIALMSDGTTRAINTDSPASAIDLSKTLDGDYGESTLYVREFRMPRNSTTRQGEPGNNLHSTLADWQNECVAVYSLAWAEGYDWSSKLWPVANITFRV